MRRRIAASVAVAGTVVLAPHGHHVRPGEPHALSALGALGPNLPGGAFDPRPISSEASRSAPLAPLATTSTTAEPVRTVPLAVRAAGHLEVTAYCLSGVMSDGHRVHPGAAASDLYPLGTHLSVVGFGEVTVEDRSAPGATDLDLWMASCAEARQWGRRWTEVEAA